MKLFEQIAKAMYGAYRLYIQTNIGFSVPSWDSPVMYEKKAWIAAAKASHKEIAKATTNMLKTAREDTRDAQRYRWLVDYFVSDRDDLDDAIVAARTSEALSKVIDAAIAAEKENK